MSKLIKTTKLISFLITNFLTFSKAYAQQDLKSWEIKTDSIPKQRDLIDIFKKQFNLNLEKENDSAKGPYSFTVLPLTTEVPGGGRALVTTVTTSFYLGNRRNTNLSEIWFVPYFDFDGRYGLPIRSYVWLNENKWLLKGDWRMLKYPEYTYGLGKMNNDSQKILVDRSYYRFYQQVLRKVSPGLMAGVGYNLDLHSKIETDGNFSLKDFTKYNYGTENHKSTVSSGLSLNVLYDTRGNSINPDGGQYFNMEYRVNPEFLGSDYSWHSLYVDARTYYKLKPGSKNKNLLALWSYYWTTFNSNPPYFDLPSIGWDTFNTSARGFQQSRFRAKSLFYFEAEYRRDLTKDGLLGFVLFANANSTNDPNSRLFKKWSIGAGGGLRVKVDKTSGVNIALDYGVSKEFQGVYLTLGEFF